MSIDPSTIDRLSQSIAQALEQLVAPMRRELEALRAEVAHLRAQAGGAPSTARMALSAAATKPAGRGAAALPRGRTTRGAAPDLECRVPQCPAPVLARQLCETHYRIMRRTVAGGKRFDPAAQDPVELRAPARGCSETDCNEPHYAKDLCRRHYMATRARLRAQGQNGKTQAAVSKRVPLRPVPQPPPAAPADAGPTPSASFAGAPMLDFAMGGSPSENLVAMPTAEVVAKVVGQYRGGLSKVAEVLGRNRRTLMELLEKLNLMEHVVSVRAGERKRILAAPLQEKLADLLFREKLLEDLGCLKEVDESARQEVQARCAQFTKTCETQDEAFKKLAAECGLEESGLKRLVWRYDLRRQLRGLKPSRTMTPVRTRV